MLKLICFTFLVLIQFPLYANLDSLQQIWKDETKADSIRFTALYDYCRQNAYSAPDTVVAVAEHHYTLAKAKNSKREMAKALDNKALAYCMKGDYDLALIEMEQVKAMMSVLNDSISTAKTISNMGSVYYYQSNFKEAVRSYNQAISIFEAKKMEDPQANILINLGLIYYEINNFQLAVEYFDEALAIFEKLGIEDKIGNIWLNLGETYLKQGNPTKAMYNGRKAIGILQKINNKVSLADSYHLLASAYQKQNELDSALVYVDKSLALSQEIGHLDKINSCQILLANLMYKSDVKKATLIGESVLEAVKDDSNFTPKVGVYHLLYKCYKKQGNTIKALAMHENYTANKDSLLVEEDNISIIREAIQSEYEIKLFNKQLENEQVQSQIKMDQLRKTYGILLACVVLILLTIFYARSKIVEQRREKENLLKEIELLKSVGNKSVAMPTMGFQLDRSAIENSIEKKINETDWKVLNVLLDDPVISNKGIAEQVYLSIDGIGSCLRRMYEAFDVKESKYKKISLIMKAIKLSNI